MHDPRINSRRIRSSTRKAQPIISSRNIVLISFYSKSERSSSGWIGDSYDNLYQPSGGKDSIVIPILYGESASEDLAIELEERIDDGYDSAASIGAENGCVGTSYIYVGIVVGIVGVKGKISDVETKDYVCSKTSDDVASGSLGVNSGVYCGWEKIGSNPRESALEGVKIISAVLYNSCDDRIIAINAVLPMSGKVSIEEEVRVKDKRSSS